MLYHLTAHSTAITALGKTRAKLEAALAESFQENHPTEDGKQQILQFCRQNAHKPQGLEEEAKKRGWQGAAAAERKTRPDWRSATNREAHGSEASSHDSSHDTRVLKQRNTAEELESFEARRLEVSREAGKGVLTTSFCHVYE